MKGLSYFLCIFLLPGILCADIYKTRESNGVISFSDKPMRGSKLVPLSSLAAINTFSVPGTQSSSGLVSSALPSNRATMIATNDSYTVQITSPAADTIFQLANKPYKITATVSPAIQSQDNLKVDLFIYDGNVAASKQTDRIFLGSLNSEGVWEFSVPQLNTGAQLLLVRVAQKQDGKVLGTSEPVQVYFKHPPVRFHVGPVLDRSNGGV